MVNNERDDARDDAGEAEEQKPSEPKPRVRPEDPALEEIASLGAYAADTCLLYTSPSPRDGLLSRMPSSA